MSSQLPETSGVEPFAPLCVPPGTRLPGISIGNSLFLLLARLGGQTWSPLLPSSPPGGCRLVFLRARRWPDAVPHLGPGYCLPGVLVLPPLLAALSCDQRAYSPCMISCDSLGPHTHTRATSGVQVTRGMMCTAVYAEGLAEYTHQLRGLEGLQVGSAPGRWSEQDSSLAPLAIKF